MCSSDLTITVKMGPSFLSIRRRSTPFVHYHRVFPLTFPSKSLVLCIPGTETLRLISRFLSITRTLGMVPFVLTVRWRSLRVPAVSCYMRCCTQNPSWSGPQETLGQRACVPCTVSPVAVFR